MCDTYNCDYLKHRTFRFNLINFQLNTDFKDWFLKQMLIKELKPVAFLHKTIGSDNSFTLIENNFRF